MSDKPKLTKLEQFPCPYCDGPTKFCKPDCLAALGGVDTNCQVVDIYRKAMADHKCARLLRVFVKRGTEDALVITHWATWVMKAPFSERFARFSVAIRDALRAAGLE